MLDLFWEIAKGNRAFKIDTLSFNTSKSLSRTLFALILTRLQTEDTPSLLSVVCGFAFRSFMLALVFSITEDIKHDFWTCGSITTSLPSLDFSFFVDFLVKDLLASNKPSLTVVKLGSVLND